MTRVFSVTSLVLGAILELLSSATAQSVTARHPLQPGLPNPANFRAIHNGFLAVHRAQIEVDHKLSQVMRRRIAQEENAAMQRSIMRSQQKTTVNPSSTDLLNMARVQDSQWDRSLQLMEKKYHLSKAELAAIMVEGEQKGWTSPVPIQKPKS